MKQVKPGILQLGGGSEDFFQQAVFFLSWLLLCLRESPEAASVCSSAGGSPRPQHRQQRPNFRESPLRAKGVGHRALG